VLHALGVRAEAELAERARGLRRDRDLADSRGHAQDIVADLEGLLERWQGAPAVPDALANAQLARAEAGRVEGSPEPEWWGAAAEAWEALAEPHPAEAVGGQGGRIETDPLPPLGRYLDVIGVAAVVALHDNLARQRGQVQ